MVPSKNCIDLIKKFEGCRLEAYLCPAGRWTIGYGQTGPGIREGLTITQKTAEAMLTGTVREVGIDVADALGQALQRLNQSQYDALVSLTYNIGILAFKKSTILSLIKGGYLGEASCEFVRWDKANGEVLSGLLKRREAEKALFLQTL